MKNVKKKKRQGKEKDLFIVLALNFVGVIYFFLTRDTFFGKPLLVYASMVLPATTFLIRKKKMNWKRIIPATIVLGGVIGFTIDFISELTKTWTVIKLIFPYKIFGVAPIDNTLWFIMMTFYTLIFYEYFITHEKKKGLSKHFKFLLIASVSVVFILIGIFLLKPSSLQITYPYLTLGIAAITLPVLMGFLKPKIFNKMLLIGIYFFFLYFTFEIIAVGNQFWVFNGKYIGTISFFGLVFPFEELFFWMMFYAPTLVAFYEEFVDDE